MEERQVWDMPEESGFETLEHTADEGFRVWAPDLDGLFAEAAKAVMAMMGTGAGPDVHRERVSIEAPDLPSLLVDWLSEVLYLFEARDLVPEDIDVRVTEGAPCRLSAEISGPDAASFEQQGAQVKAITYHGLEVRRGVDGFEARVYVDV